MNLHFLMDPKVGLNFTLNPVPEGILILSIDITKNKEIEAELNKYRYRLEACSGRAHS